MCMHCYFHGVIFIYFCLSNHKLMHRHIESMLKHVVSFATSMINVVGLFVQGLSLPVKQEDKEILDLVILKVQTLQQKVCATLGSSLPLQVGLA